MWHVQGKKHSKRTVGPLGELVAGSRVGGGQVGREKHKPIFGSVLGPQKPCRVCSKSPAGVQAPPGGLSICLEASWPTDHRARAEVQGALLYVWVNTLLYFPFPFIPQPS